MRKLKDEEEYQSFKLLHDSLLTLFSSNVKVLTSTNKQQQQQRKHQHFTFDSEDGIL